MTPASVAMRIRVLETELGTRLIVRSGRKVAPTEAGWALVEQGRLLLRDFDNLKSSLTTENPRGELTIGAVPTAVNGLMPRILGQLQSTFPNIEVNMVPSHSEELYHKVLDAELDGAIIIEPYFGISKACGWHVLREEPLLLIAPKSMEGEDAHSALVRGPFIRYGRSIWGGRFVEQYLTQANIRPKVRFELSTLDAIAVMVDRGLGVSLVPDWSPPWPAGLSLSKLQLPLPAEPRRLGFIWMRKSPRTNLLRLFLQQAKRALK